MSGPTDRQALDHPAAKDAASLWKTLIKNEAEDQQVCNGVNFQTILSGEDRQQTPKMCRKCFYSYRKLVESQQNIRRKLRNAVEVLCLFSSPSETLPHLSKRTRLGSPDRSSARQTARGQSSQSEAMESPKVSVSDC